MHAATKLVPAWCVIMRLRCRIDLATSMRIATSYTPALICMVSSMMHVLLPHGPKGKQSKSSVNKLLTCLLKAQIIVARSVCHSGQRPWRPAAKSDDLLLVHHTPDLPRSFPVSLRTSKWHWPHHRLSLPIAIAYDGPRALMAGLGSAFTTSAIAVAGIESLQHP